MASSFNLEETASWFAEEALVYVKNNNYQDAAFFTLISFLITEAAVWIPTWVFDAMEERWSAYRVRQPTVYESATMDKVRKEQEAKRINGYTWGWILYLITWGLSNMSVRDNFWPTSIIDCFKDNLHMIVILDIYIYFLHAWLHWRHDKYGGHGIHSVHHSHRFVGCWYVDHEDGTESICIALAKYGLLAYFSPPIMTAFVYLWVVKFWNVIHHCGYNLPVFQFIDKYLPFIDTPNCHELHHFHHLDGNYAVFFTIWDFVLGTECRDDVTAFTKFGHGKVKYGHEMTDKETGEKKQSSYVSRQLLARTSIVRRFRHKRETNVHTLTKKQIEKLRYSNIAPKYLPQADLDKSAFVLDNDKND